MKSNKTFRQITQLSSLDDPTNISIEDAKMEADILEISQSVYDSEILNVKNEEKDQRQITDQSTVYEHSEERIQGLTLDNETIYLLLDNYTDFKKVKVIKGAQETLVRFRMKNKQDGN